jgi:hypothetical protein
VRSKKAAVNKRVQLQPRNNNQQRNPHKKKKAMKRIRVKKKRMNPKMIVHLPKR